ncbi:class I SAM-dependent methyltransferase, partial [Planctomycetota bacterium]
PHLVSVVSDLAPTNKGYTNILRASLPSLPDQTAVRVLELACGRAPLLAALFKDHTSERCADQPCASFGRQVDYTGADLGCPDALKDESDKWAHRYGQCFPRIEFVQCDLTNGSHLSTLIERGPHHVVTLSNALHEIPPPGWPALLASIPDMLYEGGVFVLIDLIPKARFCRDLWLGDHKVLCDRSWEAGAVWVDLQDAKQLVRTSELGIADHRDKMGYRDEWWYLVAKRPTGPLPPFEDRVTAIRRSLMSILEEQASRWDQDFPPELARARAAVEQADDPGLTIAEGIRYLCLCASQCVRRASSGEVGGTS